jgi:hypothetical protein
MSVIPEPPRRDLIAAAHAVRRAKVSDDVDCLHLELAHVRSSLVFQVHSQTAVTADESAPSPATVDAGRVRLLGLLNDLLFSRDGDGPGSCACLARALEVELALCRQARLEERMRRR